MRPLPKSFNDYLNRVTSRALRQGDVVRYMDGSFHYIEYVNSSGAYCVPLSAVNREIAGTVVAFTAGGKTISVFSAVEVVNPLIMGGSSQEYKRYVTMVKKSKARTTGSSDDSGGAALVEQSASLGEFDSTPLSPESEAAEGHLAELAEQPPTVKVGKGMAKKTAKVKTVRAEKPPKTVRACACGCGGQTTGHFAPGHDARLHGWIAKLADGRIEPKDIPAITRKNLGLVQTKTGYKATTPHFYKS